MIPARADIVVVGGGSAGCTLAATLAGRPGRTVVLLESGPGYASTGTAPPELLDASRLPVGPESRWTAQYPVLLAGRPGTIARGRVLGGSGAVNGGYFVRGRPGDFDAWPPSWSFDHVLPYFRLIEHDSDFGDEWHGAAGPVPVSRTPWSRLHPVARAFHDAAVAAGHLPVEDLNAPGPVGVGRVPLNIANGVRMGPALSSLMPALASPNLTVCSGTRARRVVMSGAEAVGVEVDGGDGVAFIEAGSVVLCAGAVESPRLLLLSGIGPADELATLGVAPVVDLPGVGTGFTDHPEVAVPYRYRSDLPLGTAVLETVLHTDELELRPYTAPFADSVPGSGAAVPVLGVVLTRPRSRGRLIFDARDPYAAALLDYGYLDDPRDRAALRHGVASAVHLLAAMDGVVDPHSVQAGAADVDDEWLAAHLGTSQHLSGSCRMGSDDSAVVDDRCRVHGAERLFVADTSVFPQVPSRGPHATVVMLARRVADAL